MSNGIEALCAALYLSAYNDNDKSFFSSELGEMVINVLEKKMNKKIPLITKVSRRKKRAWDSAELRSYAKKMTLSELAAYYHTDKQSMRCLLSKNHVEWKDKQKQGFHNYQASVEFRNKMIVLCKKYNAEEISLITGKKIATILQYAKRNGIELKRKARS